MTHFFSQAELENVKLTSYPGIFTSNKDPGEDIHSARKTMVTAEALGTALFITGFKNITKATCLVKALTSLAGKGLLQINEHSDRVELLISYVRCDVHREDNLVAKINTTAQIAMLRGHLSRLVSPFKLEVMNSPIGHMCYLALTLIKTPILVVINPDDTPVMRIRNDSQRTQVMTDAILVAKEEKSPNFDLDLLFFASRKASIIEEFLVDDYWRDLKFSFKISSIGFLAFDQAIKYTRFYTERISKLYRFIVIHETDGYTRLEAFRRIKLD